MSNINQNNFNNCLRMRLSNSDYWDLFLCNDCRCSLDQPLILSGDCLIIDIDVNNPHSLTGDSLCSLVKWDGDTCFERLSVPTSTLTLHDIGLTGIGNGFVTYDCSASTSSLEFLDVFTGTTLTLTSADTRFCFTRVTGCTYNYPIEIIDSGTTVGKYAQLCGGFYQGFFKLSDRTFFNDISNNMFTWPLDWFYCPPSCCPISSGTTGTTGTTTSNCCGGGCNGCGCSCNQCNPLFIPGSCMVSNCSCGGGGCQLCGTMFEKDGMGGCGPQCSNCCGKGDGNGGCCVNPHMSYKCYNDKKPKPWDYQILPTRYECGWTAEFWVRRNSNACSGLTANTLNTVFPNNEGFFYYMGTRAENKFWDFFSGETGYTTSSGYPLPPPKTTKTELLNNPFLVYQPQGCCCFPDVVTVTTHERDRNADIVNNALGFRIRNDGSIGYRSIGMSGVCSAVTTTYTTCCTCGCCPSGTTTFRDTKEKWVTGVTINEEYSASGVVADNQWVMIAIRFRAYEEYELREISNVPRRKGRLDFFIDGYLKYSIENFDEFLFKDLMEYREKQEGVPFNYSLGGGTQGLLETNTVNGPDPKDENLVIENNFAGTFYGDLSKFRLYACCLDITTIRYRFNELCADFGICPFDQDCYVLTEGSIDILTEDGKDLLTWCDE